MKFVIRVLPLQEKCRGHCHAMLIPGLAGSASILTVEEKT